MIVGIGLDIIEIDRIQVVQQRQNKLAKRILTEQEFLRFDGLSPKRKREYLAGRFAAKEAYAKAVGTGIGESLSFQDIEIMNDEKGKPVIKQPTDYRTHLSISHSDAYAVAQVILED